MNENNQDQLLGGRCWKGYEPTPGVKAYAKGSCRLKAGKRKRSTPRKRKRSAPRKRKRKKSKSIRRSRKYYRSTASGAGMTKAGVAAYRKANPGSKLRTAVTGKVKPGSKNAARRRSFCARSRGWTGPRGKAARRRWKC